MWEALPSHTCLSGDVLELTSVRRCSRFVECLEVVSNTTFTMSRSRPKVMSRKVQRRCWWVFCCIYSSRSKMNTADPNVYVQPPIRGVERKSRQGEEAQKVGGTGRHDLHSIPSTSFCRTSFRTCDSTFNETPNATPKNGTFSLCFVESSQDFPTCGSCTYALLSYTTSILHTSTRITAKLELHLTGS